MRFNRLFVVCVLLFLAVVFFSELRAPKHFRWEPTFSHSDRQPFGCYVFDSVLAASLPQGYSVDRRTLYQLRSLRQPHGILVVARSLSQLGTTDVRSALHLARQGHRLLLVGGYGGSVLFDSLQCSSSLRGYSQGLVQYVRSGMGRDTIEWLADNRYGWHEYYYYKPLIDYELQVVPDAAGCRVLSRVAHSGDSDADSVVSALALTFNIGKGSITWACTPLVFTNYGMLDGANQEYVFRLLSQTGGLPVVRTEAYMPAMEDARQTPLRFIISQRPLRWALYLSLAAVLLVMLFGCRRRQRVIPVIEPPRNNLLEFVRLIGTLHYQRRNKKEVSGKQ